MGWEGPAILLGKMARRRGLSQEQTGRLFRAIPRCLRVLRARAGPISRLRTFASLASFALNGLGSPDGSESRPYLSIL